MVQNCAASGRRPASAWIAAGAEQAGEPAERGGQRCRRSRSNASASTVPSSAIASSSSADGAPPAAAVRGLLVARRRATACARRRRAAAAAAPRRARTGTARARPTQAPGAAHPVGAPRRPRRSRPRGRSGCSETSASARNSVAAPSSAARRPAARARASERRNAARQSAPRCGRRVIARDAMLVPLASAPRAIILFGGLAVKNRASCLQRRSPSIAAQRGQPSARARARGHAAERDHRHRRVRGEQAEAQRAERLRAGMRAGREDRREQHRVGARAVGAADLAQRCAVASVSRPLRRVERARRAVDAVGAPFARGQRAVGEDHAGARARGQRGSSSNQRATALGAADGSAGRRSPSRAAARAARARAPRRCARRRAATGRAEVWRARHRPAIARRHGKRSHPARRRSRSASRTPAAVARRERGEVTLVAVSKTHPAEAIAPLIEAGPARVRREPRAGSAGQVARAARALSRRRAAPRRPAAVEQGRRGGGAVRLRSIRSTGRAWSPRWPRRWTRPGGGCRASSRSTSAPRSRRAAVAIAELPALLAEARAAEIPLAGLMCVPPLEIEPAPFFALLDKLARDHGLAGRSHGHERRLRDRDHARRDARPRSGTRAVRRAGLGRSLALADDPVGELPVLIRSTSIGPSAKGMQHRRGPARRSRARGSLRTVRSLNSRLL